MTMHAGALAAAPLAANGLSLDGTTRPAPDDPAGFIVAVAEAAQSRMSAFVAGLQRYQNHAYRRDLPEMPVAWAEGATRLLDYGGQDNAAGPALLVVPSLINRYYVLDLMAGRSLLRWLTGRGFRPFVVDWGEPGEAERGLDLSGHVGRLGRALDAVRERAGRPALVGYCMGGTLSVALAQHRQADLAALALLATPWDFHADGKAADYASLAKVAAPVLSACGCLPVDLLQALFASLDPLLGWRKFRRLAALPEGGDGEREFVAVEDWLNDGAALPQAVAWECLFGWYAENRPGQGQWRLDGEPVRPEAIDLPALVAVPRADRIVPPASARALADRLPRAETLRPPSGHIGMVVSRRAEQGLWEPLADWLDIALAR
ncbi:MAG: alpha/beta fold hydrolase [Alphaproteobacteria bacterium]